MTVPIAYLIPIGVAILGGGLFLVVFAYIQGWKRGIFEERERK